MNESYRPIKLNIIVKGYKNSKNHNAFELSLSHKLNDIINTYAESKQTLIVLNFI